MTSRVAPRPLAGRAAFGFGTGIGIGVALGPLAWLADQLAYPWGALIPANAFGAAGVAIGPLTSLVRGIADRF